MRPKDGRSVLWQFVGRTMRCDATIAADRHKVNHLRLLKDITLDTGEHIDHLWVDIPHMLIGERVQIQGEIFVYVRALGGKGVSLRNIRVLKVYPHL